MYCHSMSVHKISFQNISDAFIYVHILILHVYIYIYIIYSYFPIIASHIIKYHTMPSHVILYGIELCCQSYQTLPMIFDCIWSTENTVSCSSLSILFCSIDT